MANGSDVEIVYNGSYLQFVTSAEILDVTVFDVAGRVVMRANDGKNTLHVGSAGLVNGLYIVKVATSAGSAAKQIVVK